MKTVISPYQTTLILIFTILATSIISLPSLLIDKAANDSWLSLIIIALITTINAFIYAKLGQKMQRIDLINYTRKIFGDFITIPIALLTIAVFLLLAGTVIRETAEVMQNAYMPMTPLRFFNITIILTASYIVYHGLEVLGRSLEVFFYLFLAFFIFILIVLISDLNLSNLNPVLANGYTPVLKSSIMGLTFFNEIFLILIIAPQITTRGKILRPTLYAIFISTIILSAIIIFILSILGSEMAKELSFPFVTMVSYPKKLMVIERFDPLFIFFWIAGGIYKTAIFFYAASYTAQKLFKKSTYYIFIIPFIVILFYISFNYFQNYAQLTAFIKKSTPYFFSFFLIYPLLLLIFSYFKKGDTHE